MIAANLRIEELELEAGGLNDAPLNGEGPAGAGPSFQAARLAVRYLVIVIDAVLVGRVVTRYRSVRNAPTQGPATVSCRSSMPRHRCT